MKRWRKRKQEKPEYKLDKSMQPWFLKLMAFAQCFAIILFNYYAFSMLYVIMICGKELKGWTVPLMLLHMFFLAFLAGWLQFRKVKREQHMILGDELYYKEYPRDLWYQERRLAWIAAMKVLKGRPPLQRYVLSFCVALASGLRRKKYRYRQPSSGAPLVQILACFGFYLVCFIPLYGLFLQISVLGWGALVLMVLYVGALAAVAWGVDERKDRLLEHMLLGDEDYYARYPLSGWLHDKHLAWRRLRRRVGNPTIYIPV